MKVYIYCTKAKPYLHKRIDNNYYLADKNIFTNTLNGLVVASFDLNRIEEIECYYEKCEVLENEFPYIKSDEMSDLELEETSCLGWWEIWDYLKGKNGYAYHIENLEIIDPLELSEFEHIIYPGTPSHKLTPILKAPQDFMYAYYKCERVLILSIRPKWVEKILNGEKTVEVRKREPKEATNE